MCEEVKSNSDLSSFVQQKIDEFEQLLLNEPQIECPVQHFFTPGLYTRQILIPRGTFLTSKIHKTQHPFIISVGKITVFTETEGEQLLEAPYMGITQPHTRRVLYAHEDTVWTTFHATDKTTVEEVEEEIIIKREHFKSIEGGIS